MIDPAYREIEALGGMSPWPKSIRIAASIFFVAMLGAIVALSVIAPLAFIPQH